MTDPLQQLRETLEKATMDIQSKQHALALLDAVEKEHQAIIEKHFYACKAINKLCEVAFDKEIPEETKQ